jgi:hypothetical protein
MNSFIAWPKVKEKKNYFRLKTEDEEIEGEKEVLDHATNYYKSLFAHSGKNDFEVDDLLWKDDEKSSVKIMLCLVRNLIRRRLGSCFLNGKKQSSMP